MSTINATTGSLVAISIDDPPIISAEWLLDGEPHSVTVSPYGNYVVILINSKIDEEIDEEFLGCDHDPPVGSIIIVNSTSHDLEGWSISTVDISNGSDDDLDFSELFDPKSVAINTNNVAAITLQENNAILLIDLEIGAVVSSFSAGPVDLDNIDISCDMSPRDIDQSSSLNDIPREPDGITFIRDNFFATGVEGFLKEDSSGGRSLSIFDVCGDLVYNSGSEMDQIAVSVGHYDDKSSHERGIEPENVAFGAFEGADYLFITGERVGLTYVYYVSTIKTPKFKQVLLTGIRPEGIKAIPNRNLPNRNLLAVAASKDSRENAIRSTISIFEYTSEHSTYPTLKSQRDPDTGVAIPWAAISGLTDAKKGYFGLFQTMKTGDESNFQNQDEGQQDCYHHGGHENR